MFRFARRLPGCVVLLAAVATPATLFSQAPDDLQQFEFFEKQIRPVLVAECYECHATQSKNIEGALTLDTLQGMRTGGERGPAVVPGSPDRSLLMRAIRHTDSTLQMPPEKKLSPEVIAAFEQWISMGAPDPRDGPVAVAARYEVDMEQGRQHWAFQPPVATAVPQIADIHWPRTDVDRFILARQESRGLTPVGDADRRTLLRRLTFDLTGLPPSPAEVEAFLADDAADALEEAIDRLLSSPHYGEKWARHWLDLARFAESTGKTVNFYYPNAWRYRDYVIAAFNEDKPYDQFVREQLAGDLMPSDDPRVTAERLIATGFLAIGPRTLNERNGLRFELDAADEQIDVTTQAFLGITVACARCHDHKFDPIRQTDYYALAGIFRSTETCYGTVRYINAQRPSSLLPLSADAAVTTAMEPLADSERRRIEGEIESARNSIRTMRDGVQQFFAMGRISLLQARLDGYDENGAPRLLAMGVRDKRTGVEPPRNAGRFGGPGGFSYDGTQVIGDSPVYLRGEPDQPSDSPVRRGTLQVMTSAPLEVAATSSGRLELANWIASRDNSLTARVMVNRIWLQLFGRGLVPTADDFGLKGRPPTHPELLDHLAIRFMDEGWSTKRLIRYLVTSHAYQLSAHSVPAALEIDPDNALIWRMAPRRYDAESLRDAMLAVSDQLDPDPPVGSVVAQAGEGPVTRFGRDPIAAAINDPRNTKRSVYLPIIRDNLPEAMALFDAADPSLITANRSQTTVPAQGLFLLNNEFVLRASDAAAARLLDEPDESARIHQAFQRCFGRPPVPEEVTGAGQFLASFRAQLREENFPEARREREVWSSFCQALFASAEFQYRM